MRTTGTSKSRAKPFSLFMTIVLSSGGQRILTGLCIAIISIVTFVIHYQHHFYLEHYYLFGRLADNRTIIIESSSSSSSVTDKSIRTNLKSIASPSSPRPSSFISLSAATGTMSRNISNEDVVRKYLKDDYKAFIFATHPLHGLLLLYCTRKKKKGPHYQAPGGHVDKDDYDRVIAQSNTLQGPELLMRACKMGAARELFEETGMDYRSTLDRLQPIDLGDDYTDSMINELHCRLFFKLCLDDADFMNIGGKVQPLNKQPPHLTLKLSHEHQGFVFEPNTTKAVNMLLLHSGGKVSKALEMAISNDTIDNLDLGSKIIGMPIERTVGVDDETTLEKKGFCICC